MISLFQRLLSINRIHLFKTTSLPFSIINNESLLNKECKNIKQSFEGDASIQRNHDLETLKQDLTDKSIDEIASILHEKCSENIALTERIKLQRRKIQELEKSLTNLNPFYRQKGNNSINEKKRDKLFDSFISQQYALKCAYIGINYQGLVCQPEVENTIEEHIFNALEKTMLIQSRTNCNFTRSGRTDRGVSALSQIFSVSLRTSIQKDQDSSQTENQLDYVSIINSQLPDDIRILNAARVADTFNARFDCIQRVYKYYFFENQMDISKIKEAAAKLVGEHDFRNFCKKDPSQPQNFVRKIHSIDIDKVQVRTNQCPIVDTRQNLFVATITGNAFLWHQIRLIMGVLFLIGKRQEQPTLVNDLLNINKFTEKPNYQMAPDFPLILHDCRYENLRFEQGESQVQIYDHFLQIIQRREIENQLFYAPLAYLKEATNIPTDFNIISRSKARQEEANMKFANRITK